MYIHLTNEVLLFSVGGRETQMSLLVFCRRIPAGLLFPFFSIPLPRLLYRLVSIFYLVERGFFSFSVLQSFGQPRETDDVTLLFLLAEEDTNVDSSTNDVPPERGAEMERKQRAQGCFQGGEE